jgi:hypothetical protein
LTFLTRYDEFFLFERAGAVWLAARSVDDDRGLRADFDARAAAAKTKWS